MSSEVWHCGICGAEWTGTGPAHCKGGGKTDGCHETFGSDAAFDRHRKNFKCVPVGKFGDLDKHGKPLLVKGSRGFWVTALYDEVAHSSTPA